LKTKIEKVQILKKFQIQKIGENKYLFRFAITEKCSDFENCSDLKIVHNLKIAKKIVSDLK
jgi:hypothetical protein